MTRILAINCYEKLEPCPIRNQFPATMNLQYGNEDFRVIYMRYQPCVLNVKTTQEIVDDREIN